jgi:predicted 3-demethylubiquinone-9 3-methyltransferase (glyoxalase superfamily)
MNIYPYEPSKSALRLQKIIPCLWYDKEAVEAAELYVSLFWNSEILSVTTLSGTPSGEVVTVEFKLSGFVMSAISAGPHFKMNPSLSLMVSCSTKEEVDRLYDVLSDGGSILMPLDAYPFSARYAWITDKFGLSWQLFLTEASDQGQQIRPCLLFAADACGKAEQALSLYPAWTLSVPTTRMGNRIRAPKSSMRKLFLKGSAMS